MDYTLTPKNACSGNVLHSSSKAINATVYPCMDRISPTLVLPVMYSAGQRWLPVQTWCGEATEAVTNALGEEIMCVTLWRFIVGRISGKWSAAEKEKCCIFLCLFNKPLIMVGASGLRECVFSACGGRCNRVQLLGFPAWGFVSG